MTIERAHALGFVIWLDPESNAHHLRGSVEHVSSSVRLRFADTSELLRFLASRLEDNDAAPARATDPNDPRNPKHGSR